MAGEIKEIKQWDDISKIEVDPVRVVDPGVGKEVILRHFFFKAGRRPKGVPNPTKQEIVSYFKKFIEISLWSDGLIIREDKPLEVHTRAQARQVSKALYMKMREEGSDFVILCLAEPRRGQTVQDKAHRA